MAWQHERNGAGSLLFRQHDGMTDIFESATCAITKTRLRLLFPGHGARSWWCFPAVAARSTVTVGVPMDSRKDASARWFFHLLAIQCYCCVQFLPPRVGSNHGARRWSAASIELYLLHRALRRGRSAVVISATSGFLAGAPPFAQCCRSFRSVPRGVHEGVRYGRTPPAVSTLPCPDTDADVLLLPNQRRYAPDISISPTYPGYLSLFPYVFHGYGFRLGAVCPGR